MILSRCGDGRTLQGGETLQSSVWADGDVAFVSGGKVTEKLGQITKLLKRDMFVREIAFYVLL